MNCLRICIGMLLLLMLHQSCQKAEVETKKIVADRWIPAFLKYDHKSFKDSDKLFLSYQEEDEITFLGIKKRVYPPYFGGSYFCRERKEHVILLTDTSAVIKNDLIKLCSLTLDNTVFKQCKYSLNELFDVLSNICSLEDLRFFEVGVSVKNNQAYVLLDKSRDENENAIRLIRSVVPDSNILVFRFVENTENADVQFNKRIIDDEILEKAPYPYTAGPGKEFFTALDGKISNRGSIGFVINEKVEGFELRGFVTANHCVYSDQIYFKAGNAYAPFACRLDKNLRIDAAACIILTQSCNFTSSIPSNLAMPEMNMEVSIDGASSGAVSGIIRDYIYHDFGHGKCLLYKVEARVQEGDSGGPVYTPNGIIGMLIGRDPDSKYAYLVPADIILEFLDLTLGS